MDKQEIIRSVMPKGKEMTASDISNSTKGERFLTLQEVSYELSHMDDIKYVGKRSKTLKVPVEAHDEDGPILDEDGNPVIEYVKRRKEYRYWVRGVDGDFTEEKISIVSKTHVEEKHHCGICGVILKNKRYKYCDKCRDVGKKRGKVIKNLRAEYEQICITDPEKARAIAEEIEIIEGKEFKELALNGLPDMLDGE